MNGQKRIIVNSRHFVVISRTWFRRRADRLLKICLSELEVLAILAACHDSAFGGHFSGQFTGQKILRASYFWPTFFKDSHTYIKKCDACRRYARNDVRLELTM